MTAVTIDLSMSLTEPQGPYSCTVRNPPFVAGDNILRDDREESVDDTDD